MVLLALVAFSASPAAPLRDEPWRTLAAIEEKGENSLIMGEVRCSSTEVNGKEEVTLTNYRVKKKGEAFYVWTKTMKDGNEPYGFEAIVAPGRFLMINYAEQNGVLKVKGMRSKHSPPGDAEYAMLTNSLFLAPHGYLMGYLGWNRVSAIVRASITVNEGGGGAFRARTGWGDLEWRINRITGDLERITLTKGIGHLSMTGGRVSKIDGASGYLGMRAMFEFKPGLIQATACKSYREGETKQTYANTYRISPLPPDEAEFSLSIPLSQGVNASLVDDPAGQYEWRDGKVQARASKKFLQYAATLDANTARPGYGVIIGSILVAGVLLAAVLWLASRLKGTASP